MTKLKDLTGQRFGRWKVIKYAGKRFDGHHMWWCLCDCGAKRKVSRNRLFDKGCPSRSCGCRQKEFARGQRKWPLETAKLHYIWTAMKQRCLNPRCPEYKHYGARGITVCDRWLEFGPFWEDMGNPPNLGLGGLYLERIDNDGNYEPGNCKWATIEEQLLNKRKTIKLTYQGVTKPLKTWCKEMGLNYENARYRMKTGRPVEEILSPDMVSRWDKEETHVSFITYNGKTQRVGAWAKETGLHKMAIYARLRRGWSVEEALTTPSKKT